LRKLIQFALLLVALPLAAQTSVITGTTVTDSDSVVWNNATCTISLNYDHTQFPVNPPYRKDTGASFPMTPGCAINGSGALTATVTDTSYIVPANSTWTFNICPNVSSPRCGAVTIPVVGASPNISSQITAAIPAPRIGGGVGAFAYADVEVLAVPNNSYYNTSTAVGLRCYGSSWGACGSGGGGGSPGGGDLDLQVNHPAGTFAGYPYFSFNPTTAAFTIGSPTPSTPGTSSGALTWNAPYNTGSGTAQDVYDAYIQIGSGVQPFSQVIFDHPSGTTGGGEYLFLPPVHFAGNVAIQSPGNLSIANLAPSSAVCTDAFSNLKTGCSGGGGSGVTPGQFGAYGDGLLIANGCTTNGTTSIVCSAGPFVSGDVGKEIWVTGAGTAGVGFGSTIATVVSSTTVTAAATPPTNVTGSQTIFGHDDVVALQDCFNASSANNVPCVMGVPINFNTANGYLIASAGLLIPTKVNIQGSASNQGTTILSEFNGDAFSLPTSTASLQAGQPIEAVTLNNFTVFHDPSQANGRSFHINAAAGVFGFGGMFNSNFTSISSENAALECLWLDGHTNSNDNPNQYITFNQFKCNGPNQSHPANEIKITGIQAQILFINGSIDGASDADNPNPLIYIGEKTSGQSDSPVDVKFFGFTYEVGTQGLSVGEGTNNIHFDNGYIESVESPLIASNTFGLTYRGNHIANSGNIGAVAQFSNTVSATLQDNYVYGSTPPAAFAVCSGGTNSFNIDFLNNNSTVGATSACATNHAGTGAALFQANGTTATVDPSAVVITTIEDLNIQPGKTLTMYALSGGGGSFSLGTGGTLSGNAYPINLGAISSPLVITAGNTVVLALLDQGSGPAYTVVGGTNLPSVGIANATTTVGTTLISANTCTGSTTVSMPGVLTTSAFNFTPNADVSGVTGWGSSGGLLVDAWPTSGTLNYKVCNSTGSNITPGSSVTFNVSAK
jgi:hypothetical protein